MNPVADIFRQAADLLLHDARRKGNVVEIADPREMVVSGDIHGDRAALDKIIRHARPGASGGAMLVLQELIHGPPDEKSGLDRSIELLLRAARLLVENPLSVLFLMANHDLAQATGAEIMKNGGGGVCKDFVQGSRYSFGDSADDILKAADELLLSMPLAVRCPAGLWLSHSLPSPSRMTPGVMDVLRRPYVDADLRRGGGVYEWTWGRGQMAEQIDRLAAELNVEFFLVAHRHCEDGFEVVSPRCVAINSDGPAGCIVRLTTGIPLNSDSLRQYIKPIITLD